jgi:type II secretory ATPase GspE/PulE/Tfp pilus assembly ATPase PilB-like protein
VIGVLAQRLVRTVCGQCREVYAPVPELVAQFADIAAFEGFEFTRGKGCNECMTTGYDGRTGIYELLPITRVVRDLISEGADSTVISDAAREQGLRLLREDGLDKVLQGITTLEEVIRVTQDIEEIEAEAAGVEEEETTAVETP